MTDVKKFWGIYTVRFKHISLFLLCITVYLSSCGKHVRDDLKASEIEALLLTAVYMPEFYIPCSQSYLNAVFPFSSASYDCSVYRDASSTMNEFGVYACKDYTEAKALASALRSGLMARYEAFDDRYFVDEKEKYKNAVVKNIGRYVYYGILGDEEQEKITKLFIQKINGDV